MTLDWAFFCDSTHALAQFMIPVTNMPIKMKGASEEMTNWEIDVYFVEALSGPNYV